MFFRPPVMPSPSLDGLRGLGEALLQAGDVPDQLMWMWLTGGNPQSPADVRESLRGFAYAPMLGGARGGRVDKHDPVVSFLRRSGLDDLSFDEPRWSGVRVPRQLVPNETVFGTPIKNFRRPPERDTVMEPGHQFIGVMRDIAQDPMRHRMAEAPDPVYHSYIGRKADEFMKRKQKVVDSVWKTERDHFVRGLQAPRQRRVDEIAGVDRAAPLHRNGPPRQADPPEWYNMRVTLPDEARRRHKLRRRKDLGKPRGG